MNTNLLSNATVPQDASTDTRGVVAALVAALVLAFRKHLKRKAASHPDLLSRADFCAEMREMSDRIHNDHLALLEKLGSNNRELLAALERQDARISGLEAGFARLDERTKR